MKRAFKILELDNPGPIAATVISIRTQQRAIETPIKENQQEEDSDPDKKDQNT